ncbi:hypothetical protein GTY76_28025 [Streptomyces sp. SID4951]|nr:hypothetical protein [Streptomyces sp. SID4951]
MRGQLEACLDGDGARWLCDAEAKIAGSPDALAELFPRTARRCGHGPLAETEGWTVADAARTMLLLAVPHTGEELVTRVAACYRYGDAGERRAVLKALPLLGISAGGVPLVEEALRTHDARLVAAAVGPYAARWLPQHSWRHAVLTCVFTGIALTSVAGLSRRGDAELARMLRDFAHEREAAGRPVPSGVRPLIESCTVNGPTGRGDKRDAHL